MKLILLALSATSIMAFAPNVATAATIVSCGGSSACVADTDNVLLTSATEVSFGSGLTNTAPSAELEFTSFTDLLNFSASGQGSIAAVDGILNSLTFTLLDGYSFDRAEFNLLNGATNPLSVTLSTNTGSIETFILDSSNGANRFGITAAAGEVLTGVTFMSDAGFHTFSQLRLGGITSGGEIPDPSAAVPEPTTWAMMLLGFGFIGGAMRTANRRRKQTLSFA